VAHPSGNRYWIGIVPLVATAGILPLALYWLVIGRVPSVDPFVASDYLRTEHDHAVLVDVRDVAEYDASHLEGSVNWPLSQIASGPPLGTMPEQLHGKRLFLICNGGISSAEAARRLRSLGLADVWNVTGGIQSWIASAEQPGYPAIATLMLGSGEATPLPYRSAPVVEQWLAVTAGFVVKPLYMLLSAVLILMLRRQSAKDLVFLRLGLILFLIGETFCTINYLFFNELSEAVEYLHGLGMVLGLSLILAALLEGLDSRIIHFSRAADKCAAIGLCKVCSKYAQAPCGLRRLFLILIPSATILAGIPLTATTQAVSYNTTILGTPYNYTHAVVQQLFEIRFAPVAAVVLLSLSFGKLALKGAQGVSRAKVLFGVGLAYLVFSLLRLMLLSMYSTDMVWFVFWEEATELILMAAILAVLLVFRQRLLGTPSPVASRIAPMPGTP
jgi:rhodanese-related sulfurtransferase